MKNKSLIGWVGFCDDKIHIYNDKNGVTDFSMLEIYKFKRQAEKGYEDVRKVKIEEI